ncbi:hypothetical protein BX666DRAFT_337234 [Dichotomocladium elegans]|nr:hypothetical protein BX666DRAFT_337234 [Dichotomocladium elegans]
MAEDVVDVDEAVAGHGITKNPRRAKATRSLGFFGSLRQVTNRTRSQSTSSIRGLMRSISTGRNGSSGSSGSSGSRNSNRSSRNSINASNTTSPQTLISPAGLATLKHPEITNDMHRRREQQQGQQQQSEESMGNNRGIRLLSQLVGRVKRTTSPHRPTKRINMGGGSKDNERSRLVRRTIIYVQPDAENFFKTLGHLDETPVEPRETHVNSANDRQPLEGVEMREMSDGSVTWGIIKRQGRRKSFFDPQESKCEIEEDDDEETEEQIEGRVLALMGLRPDFLKDFQPNAPCHQPPPSSAPAPPAPPPIPARSPFRPQHEEATHIHSISNRRDDSTTDIYYAPNATLPSLLQMISEQDEKLKESPSVEEQLDEVIQSFSSCGYP